MQNSWPPPNSHDATLAERPTSPSKSRGRATRRLLTLAAFAGTLALGGGVASAQQDPCCQVSATGCADTTCEAAVCGLESDCCDFGWGAFCPAIAQNVCAVCADVPQLDVSELSPFDAAEPEFTPFDLAQSLMGFGVTLVPESVTFIGDYQAAGFFSSGQELIGFDDGIILSSGRVLDVVGPNIAAGMTTAFGLEGDDGLTALAGQPTFDAAILEFDFEVGAGADEIFFRYVFGSEEYNEYVYSEFNDVFALYVNGVNCALTPDTAQTPNLPVAIATINNGNAQEPLLAPTNPGLFVMNDPFDGDVDGATVAPTDLVNVEMDGFTVVLTCRATVNAGQTNTIRLAIADGSDSSLDSWILIEGESITTVPPECGNGEIEEGEACDDGALNGVTCCNVDCNWVEEDGVCGAGGGLCVPTDVEVPVVMGATIAPVVCECEEGYTLDEETQECVTQCGDGIVAGDEVCDAGEGNGSSACGCTGECTYPTAGTSCGGAPSGDCDAQDTCDGVGACVDNLQPAGTACGDASATDCSAPDTCDASGACVANHVDDGTLCTSDTLFCTGVEVCLEGACVSPGDPCDATQVCVEQAGLCIGLIGVVITAPADGALLSDPRPTITGTATPYATVDVYSGETLIGTTTADENGAWSLDPEEDLADGEHTIRAVATLGDNVSEDSVTITIDTTPPTLEIVEPGDGDTFPSGTFTVSGTTEPGATVDVYLGEELLGTVVADDMGDWSWPVDEELEDGEYTIGATATDEAGNEASDEITVNVLAPVDPCSDDALNDCDASATCVTTDDGYECVCEDGYELDDDGVCVDIDECTDGTDTCDDNATCTNTDGGYTCTCDDGYVGDGEVCDDIDECADEDICDDNATCTNTDGGYTCTCDDGYVGDGETCDDVDECADGTDVCDDNALCTNTDGGHTCVCGEGFVGDGETCTPVDDADDVYVTGGGGCAAGGSGSAPWALALALLALVAVTRRLRRE